MTRRRFIADTWTATTASLTGDQAIHLARVLRAEPGQIYDIVSNGFLHRAEIINVSETQVDFILHEEISSDAALPLHLLLAIFKFDHMEWAIEKATELGVSRITPILARRTEKHLAQAALKRSERWRRIVLEASKQSRRTTIPEIPDPIALKSALEQEKSPIRILLSETEQALTLTNALKNSQSGRSDQEISQPDTTARVPHLSQAHREPEVPARAFPRRGGDGWDVEGQTPGCPTPDASELRYPINHAMAIGPEGGWTPEEIFLFTQHQWQPVTLGPRILRAETAAIAAIAIVGSHLGA
jgi:16S rRNA (uracil1498-N3)-methyltransferase